MHPLSILTEISSARSYAKAFSLMTNPTYHCAGEVAASSFTAVCVNQGVNSITRRGEWCQWEAVRRGGGGGGGGAFSRNKQIKVDRKKTPTSMRFLMWPLNNSSNVMLNINAVHLAGWLP